jgi:hypothetical protein
MECIWNACRIHWFPRRVQGKGGKTSKNSCKNEANGRSKFHLGEFRNKSVPSCVYSSQNHEIEWGAIRRKGALFNRYPAMLAHTCTCWGWRNIRWCTAQCSRTSRCRASNSKSSCRCSYTSPPRRYCYRRTCSCAARSAAFRCSAEGKKIKMTLWWIIDEKECQHFACSHTNTQNVP